MTTPPEAPDRRARDRRAGDRRGGQGPRRDRRAPPVEESWFGALGVDDDAPSPEGAWSETPESRYQGYWPDPDDAQDSRFLSRQARRIVSAGQTAFARIYRAFVSARAGLGVALILALVVGGLLGAVPPLAIGLVCVAYAAQALSLWLLPSFRRMGSVRTAARLTRSQWFATIGVDVVSFSALHLLAPSSSLNYVALLVLPVLMAGVLTPRVMALATASGVALLLLGSAWVGLVREGDAAQLMTQAGLAGAGFFVITLLAGELAGRLAREELTARGGLELARQQAQLNRLVIEEMQDGVLVVDRRGRVRAANPAARRLLAIDGMCRPAPFQLRGVVAWQPLEQVVEQSFSQTLWPEAGRDVTIEFAPGSTRTLRVRVRFTRKREPQAGEEFCVLFIEDLRTVQARTRQEKLAAMGRVSAGIAHEIRNPLAAIAQANGLLSEDVTTADQRQLTQMVSDNVERLKRIVDDVMEVAPGQAQAPGVFDATAHVATVCSEWMRSAHWRLDDSSPLRVELPAEPVGIAFDPDHLRRVLVNLLDNARRHASGAPASISLRLHAADEAWAVLSVASDGAPIAPDVERYLFEPFFSTRSRGTGLGLYICRELCERYGASIDFRLRPPDQSMRNEFIVAMRRQNLATADGRLHLAA